MGCAVLRESFLEREKKKKEDKKADNKLLGLARNCFFFLSFVFVRKDSFAKVGSIRDRA